MEGFTKGINIGNEYERNGSEGNGDLWSYLVVANVRIIVLRLFRKSWWRTGGCNSLADGDVIEEESLGDCVANEELEEDFCSAGELSSSELMEHSGEVSGLQKDWV